VEFGSGCCLLPAGNIGGLFTRPFPVMSSLWAGDGVLGGKASKKMQTSLPVSPRTFHSHSGSLDLEQLLNFLAYSCLFL
jgi:hypothetical protein